MEPCVIFRRSIYQLAHDPKFGDLIPEVKDGGVRLTSGCELLDVSLHGMDTRRIIFSFIGLEIFHEEEVRPLLSLLATSHALQCRVRFEMSQAESRATAPSTNVTGPRWSADVTDCMPRT
jgi:hypothetical protein